MEKLRILFLDDMDTRIKSFLHYHSFDSYQIDIAQTAQEAINMLASNPKYHIVSLDHDLSEEHYYESNPAHEDTGHDVAVFIAEDLPQDLIPDLVVVHSMNPSGSERMMGTLQSGGIRCHRRIFTDSKIFTIHQGRVLVM